ncbi:MAG: hypothetical protein M3O50_09395 [Myxococcota bacterium]|nr:hypothetical protein [Myxococcota bacterium]
MPRDPTTFAVQRRELRAAGPALACQGVAAIERTITSAEMSFITLVVEARALRSAH